MYVVRLDVKCIGEDGGSAVVDAATGGLYGHIMMIQPGTEIAYIISAETVFDDIKERFGTHEVTIAPSTSAANPTKDEGVDIEAVQHPPLPSGRDSHMVPEDLDPVSRRCTMF